MKQLFILIATGILLSGQILIAQISDSAITQLYIDADLVLVCKVKKTEEIIISESNPNNSAEVNSKKVKDIYKIETESILKSKRRARAPKVIKTPEILIQSMTLSFTSNVSKDTLSDILKTGLTEMLNKQKSNSHNNYRIKNSNRHIVMLKEENDEFIIMFQEEFNSKHFKLFEKIKL